MLNLMTSMLQLKASTDFLRQAHPLKHVAPVRKSQVQHALCEVLAAMLADNVKADLPRYSLKLLDNASLCVLTGSQSKVMLFAEALKATYDMRWKAHASAFSTGPNLLQH
jgi:hypothetical protein